MLFCITIQRHEIDTQNRRPVPVRARDRICIKPFHLEAQVYESQVTYLRSRFEIKLVSERTASTKTNVPCGVSNWIK